MVPQFGSYGTVNEYSLSDVVCSYSHDYYRYGLGLVLVLFVVLQCIKANTIISDAFLPRELCSRGIRHGRVSVCLSVSVCLCLSQVGVLLKWLNVGTRKQRHTIAQGL